LVTFYIIYIFKPSIFKATNLESPEPTLQVVSVIPKKSILKKTSKTKFYNSKTKQLISYYKLLKYSLSFKFIIPYWLARIEHIIFNPKHHLHFYVRFLLEPILNYLWENETLFRTICQKRILSESDC